MLLLPKNFDSNEIYIITVAIFLIALITLLPKRYTLMESFLFYLYNLFLVSIIDHIIAGNPFDLYDVMDQAKFEVMDVFIYLFVYPLSGYIFLYFYSFFKTLNKKMAYFLLAIAITICLEWISLKFHVYTYKGWSLFYSSFSYFFLYLSNILFQKLVRSLK